MTDERGASDSIAWAILTPLLLLLILGTVQVGVWWHAQTGVNNAAVALAEEAAVARPDESGARAMAMRLAAAGGVNGVELSLTRSGGMVSATVTGRAPLLLDLGQTRVSATISRSIEEVTVP